MATVFYKGFYDDLESGALASPDERALLALGGFSFDPDSVFLTDGTLDEYDGTNYARLDLASVTTSYDATNNLWKLTATSGGAFGSSPIGPASDDIAQLVLYRHVGADSANVIHVSIDSVAGQNGAGGQLTLTVPANGLIRVKP